MVFRLVVHRERCSGCRACQLACSETHGAGFNTAQSRMFVIKEDVSGCDHPITCRFCENAACVTACPTNALTQTKNGWLALDRATCTACGSCTRACPYDALRLDSFSCTPLACDGCNGEPACVAVCATGALETAS